MIWKWIGNIYDWIIKQKEIILKEKNPINNTKNLRINNKYIIKQKNKNIDVSQSNVEKENLEYIKQKCELYLFDEKQRNIIENTLDIMFYSKELKI